MTLYAKVDSDGLIDYIVDSPIPQQGFVEIGFDPGPSPGSWLRYSISTMQWVDPRTEQQKYDFSAQEVYIKRSILLQESDWTQLPDVPLETKQAWATYRQALRDITTQEGYPFNVIWPTKPE